MRLSKDCLLPLQVKGSGNRDTSCRQVVGLQLVTESFVFRKPHPCLRLAMARLLVNSAAAINFFRSFGYGPANVVVSHNTLSGRRLVWLVPMNGRRSQRRRLVLWWLRGSTSPLIYPQPLLHTAPRHKAVRAAVLPHEQIVLAARTWMLVLWLASCPSLD